MYDDAPVDWCPTENRRRWHARHWLLTFTLMSSVHPRPVRLALPSSATDQPLTVPRLVISNLPDYHFPVVKKNIVMLHSTRRMQRQTSPTFRSPGG